MFLEIPQTIKKLIFEIQNQKIMNNALITEIIKENKLSEKDVAPFVSFNHSLSESYGRQLIFDNGNFKILLMSWKSGDFTAIHNHGYTEWGCVYFFGEATHRLYNIENDSLIIKQKDNFCKGEVASVCGDLTHIMGNASENDFATLHIYGSNTRTNDVSKDAKVYIPEFQKEVTTMGSAYLNMDKQFILSEKPLKKMNNDVLHDYFSLIQPYYERINQVGILEQYIRNLN